MALIERLMGLEEPKLPVHQFMSAIAEYKRGNMTAPQIVSAFNLSTDEQTEALTLLGVLTAEDRDDLHDVLMLAEKRIVPFNTAALVRTRLGL